MARKRSVSRGTTVSPPKPSEGQIRVFEYYAEHGSPKHKRYARKVLRELRERAE